MSPPGSPIRLLLADEHRLFLAGLTRLLSDQGLRVVGQTDCGAECLRQVQQLQPSALLLSLNLRDQSGLEVLHALRQFDQHLPVLVLAPVWSNLSFHSAVRAGANSMVSKEHDPHQLLAALKGTVLGPRCLSKSRQKQHSLSLRQLRILGGLRHGQTNEEIATSLSYSRSTIKAELRGLFETFGSQDRNHLVNCAVKQGLVGPLPQV